MWWSLRLPILQSVWWMLTWSLQGARLLKEHVFKDPIKKKFVVDWEEEQRLQQFDSKGEYIVEYKLGMITRG
jgi:hypothetical protein